MTYTFDSIFAQIFAYFTVLLALAGALQTAINTLKPQVFEPIKARVDANTYLVIMYAFRLLLTIFAFVFLWGGVGAVRSYVPFLPASVPDFGLSIFTIFLIVLGQEFIHAGMDRLYIFRDMLKNTHSALSNFEEFTDEDTPDKRTTSIG